MFKILTGKVAVDADHFFEKNQDERTRGHQLKLKKRSSRSQLRAKFFTNRVVTPWNNLPEEVVSATSTNSFKGTNPALKKPSNIPEIYAKMFGRFH